MIVAHGIVADLVPLEMTASVGCSVARRHEAEQQSSARGLLLGVEAPIGLLGRSGDRAGDAPGGAEAVDGEQAVTPAQPGFHQRVGHEREGARLGARLVEDLFDETGLEAEPGPLRGPFDRAAELGLLHRPDEHLIAADPLGQPRVRSRRGVEVGADGERHAHRAFAIRVERREDVEKRLPIGLARGVGVRQQLLELVDREQHVRPEG